MSINLIYLIFLVLVVIVVILGIVTGKAKADRFFVEHYVPMIRSQIEEREIMSKLCWRNDGGK